MPVLPLPEVAALQRTLLGFQRQFVMARANMLPSNPRTALLPYSTNSPPIPQQVLSILNEMCSSLPELSQLGTTREGKQALREALSNIARGGQRGTQAAEDIIEFWAQEIVVD